MPDVYRDFLPADHLADVRELLTTEKIPWFYNDRVVSTRKDFMFTHTFMENGVVVNPHYFEPVRGMLYPIQKKRPFIGVSRIKANLYTNQGREIVHPAHYDVPPDSGVSGKFFVAVFHVNTNNGKTVVEGEEFVSLENQLILFDNVEHYGTVQTDTETRIVINFTMRVE